MLIRSESGLVRGSGVAELVALMQTVLMVVFLWSMNLGQGMSFTVGEVLAPFKRAGVIALAVVLNSVLIPLLYWGLTRILPMGHDFAIGFMLVGFAAAAPFAIKAAVIARGDVPLGIGLVVLLGALNVVAMPLWSAILMPAGTTVNALNIAGTLVVLVLLPLAAGLYIRARWSTRAQKWAPLASKLSSIALVLLVVLMLATSWQSIVSVFGSWVITGSLIALAVSMLAGYFIAMGAPSRRASSLVSGMRAVGPALAIASSAFGENTTVIATVIVLGILSFLPFGVAIAWGKRLRSE